MKMLILTYRDSLQEEVLSFFTQEKIQAYTIIPKVHGLGQTGAAVGSLMSHGENSLVLVALADEPAQQVIAAFRTLRARLTQQQHGAGIPLKLMVMPCEEII
ncbi:MAG: hypothetical protein OEV08_08630 [Nitrospira sp.]|nr:hypothetical protein [Nitrospira sp.]